MVLTIVKIQEGLVDALLHSHVALCCQGEKMVKRVFVVCCSLKKKHFLEMSFSEKCFLQPGTPMLLYSHSEYCQLYSSVPLGMSWNAICNNFFCSIVPADHLNLSFPFRHWHVNSKQRLWCSLPTSRCKYVLLKIQFSAAVTQETFIPWH